MYTLVCGLNRHMLRSPYTRQHCCYRQHQLVGTVAHNKINSCMMPSFAVARNSSQGIKQWSIHSQWLLTTSHHTRSNIVVGNCSWQRCSLLLAMMLPSVWWYCVVALRVAWMNTDVIIVFAAVPVESSCKTGWSHQYIWTINVQTRQDFAKTVGTVEKLFVSALQAQPLVVQGDLAFQKPCTCPLLLLQSTPS